MRIRKEDWEKRIKDIAQHFPILGQKPSSEKEEKFLREINTYEFYNLEEPGLLVSFIYASGKFRCTIDLWPGKDYALPRFLAKHVENSSVPIFDWRPDGTGRMIKHYVGKKPRFRLTQKHEFKA